MSSLAFSVLIGNVNIDCDLNDYKRHLEKIESGISLLLKPVLWNGTLKLIRRVCDKKDEWLDVFIHEGPQMSMVPALEQSLGNTLTESCIQRSAAERRMLLAHELLTELRTKRHWPALELLGIVDRLGLTRAFEKMGGNNKRLTFSTRDGRKPSATLLPPRASVARLTLMTLRVRPSMTGTHGAELVLDHASKSIAKSRTRKIKCQWNYDPDRLLADAASWAERNGQWITVKCQAIDNHHGEAKSLLVHSIAA